MKALFVIDTAVGSGKGHLVRTSEIIKQFKMNGWQVVIIIEKCELGEFAGNLLNLADKLEFIESHNYITLNDIIEQALNLNCNKIIIDSYKIRYQDFSRVNLKNLEIYRILDAPTDKVDSINDIKLGIRFNLQNTSEGPKVVYPVRSLPAKKSVIGDHKRILFYFGSEPNHHQIKLADKIAENLNPDISSCIYISSELNIDTQNISAVNNVDEILPNVSLLICSASTILYEAAFLGLPCITISTNESQENCDNELQLLGHYINLKQADLIQHNEFKTLIESVLLNLKDLEAEVNKGKSNILCSSDLHIYNCIIGKSLESDLTEQKYVKPLIARTSFRPVAFFDVNNILTWRNSSDVREFMVNPDEISKLSHYNWWFKNKRDGFVYEINNTPSAYLWHEQLHTNDLSFFIGGWIPLTGDLPPLALFTILDWQIQLTKSINPNARWLAVINKENIFTQFINVKLGFKEIKSNHLLYKLATSFFKVDDKLFKFYLYEFN